MSRSSPAELLQDYRYRHRVTLQQLAERMGIGVATLNRVELGKPFSFETAEALSKVLRRTPQTLYRLGKLSRRAELSGSAES